MKEDMLARARYETTRLKILQERSKRNENPGQYSKPSKTRVFRAENLFRAMLKQVEIHDGVGFRKVYVMPRIKDEAIAEVSAATRLDPAVLGPYWTNVVRSCNSAEA